MKIWVIAVLSLAALAGCGADGEPTTPTLNAGIGIGPGGISTYGAVGLHRGPVSVLFRL